MIANLTARLRQSRELFSFTPFDGATPEGRAKERHRRMLLSTLMSATAKLVSVATALISVPLALHYAGAERYGMWLAISSFISILSFADLGLGNGLLNRIAAAYGQGDDRAIQQFISSAFGILSLIALLLLSSFWAAYSFVPWPKLFNVKDPVAVAEAAPAMAVFATCFCLSVPAAVVQKVQIGLQQSFVSSLWACMGSVLGLIAVLIVTHLRLGLPWLVGAFVGAPLTIAILNSLVFFGLQSPHIAPRRSAFSGTAARLTAQTGLLFLLLQVVAGLSFASDPLIISHILGPAVVPQYSVPERLFAVVAMVISMGLAPLWPAYGEAISRADMAWVRTTLIRSLGIACSLAAVGGGLLIFLAPTILHLWVGDAVKASPFLLVGLALWKVLETAGNSAAMFLNGAHIVRFQLIVASTTCVAIVTLKILLINWIGVPGAIWGTITGYLLCAAVPTTLKIKAVIEGRT